MRCNLPNPFSFFAVLVSDCHCFPFTMIITVIIIIIALIFIVTIHVRWLQVKLFEKRFKQLCDSPATETSLISSTD